MEIFETRLPGLGVRYEFTTAVGDPLGVVVRRDGQRELLLYDKAEPDRRVASIRVNDAEAAALVELLGGSKVTERLSDLRHDVQGLSIEWVTMSESGGLTGSSIGEGHVRTETGASIVAVIRGDESIPGPGPEFTFAAGDVVLAMGTADAVRAASRLLAP